VGLTVRQRTAFRKQVTAIIDSAMIAAGWSGEPFGRGMKLFIRAGDVTPFFLLSKIAGRPWGGYVIEGGIGILHRPFEQRWSSTATVNSNDFPTTFLHTANFLEINDLAYIDPHQPLETHVYVWCESLVRILNSLPTTHVELSLAHREKRSLAGHPLDDFLSFQEADKNAAFIKFLDDSL